MRLLGLILRQRSRVMPRATHPSALTPAPCQPHKMHARKAPSPAHHARARQTAKATHRPDPSRDRQRAVARHMHGRPRRPGNASPPQNLPKAHQKPPSLAASVSQALSSVSKRYSRKSTFVVARSPRRFRRHADAERSNALNPLVNALSALERVSNVKALFSGGHRNTHMSPSRRLCQVPLARRVGRRVRGEGRAWASPSRPSPRDCGGAARRANGVGAPFSLRQRGAAGGVGGGSLPGIGVGKCPSVGEPRRLRARTETRKPP